MLHLLELGLDKAVMDALISFEKVAIKAHS